MVAALGRYRIQGQLGHGAMSVIYRGYDPEIDRVLAIKTLRAEFAEREDYRRRFLAEARAAGTLTHPGIVTIFDVGQSGDVPFIAMELIEGPTLDQFVRLSPALSLRAVLKIAIQVADALDYAHRHGVVHRDIKPENILCTGRSGHIKVMDFGIAQIGTGPAWHADADGHVAGTPHYMAPEILRGEGADGRSDLYSLGVLLYWLLAGRTPFRADDLGELFAQIADQEAPALTPHYPDTPEALLAAVRVLLAKDPGERYQNAGEVRQALQQIDDALAERERDAGGSRIIPIRVRWTALMSALVAITMAIGLAWVYHKQRQVTDDLAFDYGFTLARLLATESAEDLLLGDRIAVQSLVEAMARNREIAHLGISDREGTVLASSQAPAIGSAYLAPPADGLVARRGPQRAYAVRSAGGERVFLFDAPIQYQDREIGRLQLGLSTAALAAANRATILAMMALMAVTLASVLVGAYVLSRRLMVPIEVLRRSLWQIAQGGLDSRIRLHRRDEFERVFTAYNAMAESLEARWLRGPSQAPAAGEAVPPGQADTLVLSQAELAASSSARATDAPGPRAEDPAPAGDA